MDGLPDNAKHQHGECRPLAFHAPDVAGGGTTVDKSGCSSAVICCGSNALLSPSPHIQLKAVAQTKEGQRTGTNWIINPKDAVAKRGFSEPQVFPCAFDMDKKGGMNMVGLELNRKCLKGLILLLFLDMVCTGSEQC